MRTITQHCNATRRCQYFSCPLILLLVLLVGCEIQQRTVRTVSVPGEDADPTRAVVEAPADLHDLSGFLLRYRVEFGVYPTSLTQLRDTDIMPASGYPGLPQYAYSPVGLGVLSKGERIMIVDRAIRIADHVWCVLELKEPGTLTAALDVRLVPWNDLRRASQRP